MSKVGLSPINLPSGVTLVVEGNVAKVTGPKGTLSLTIPPNIAVNVNNNIVSVTRQNNEKQTRALHGTTRANLNNLVLGVSQGFKKSLELVGTGYRARMNGNKLVLSLGFSHEIEYTPRAGVGIAVEGTNLIHITGTDIQAVGQTAAEIRQYRKPEPYKGKGIKYVGEVLRRKAGKAAKAGA